MTSDLRRSVEVDFLRGVVLIVIAVDHISGSALAKFMLHNYAYCDAAEVFVFLGGYASAAAYTAIATNRGAGAAIARFIQRSGEIYRAYLVTAALMLGCGALMTLFHLRTPMLELTEWPLFARQPLEMAGDIAIFRHQPYLAAVLPMYALFALGASALVPCARCSPRVTLFGSLAIWLLAPLFGEVLPSENASGWGFNPFAWQLMFVLGMLVRLHPAPAALYGSRTGVWLTRISVGVALSFAVSKLMLQTQPMPGVMKQHLAPLRIVSFAAIAWPVAVMVHRGWLRNVANRARSIVNVGQQGMACFVVGSVASLVIDTAMRNAGPYRAPFVAGLVGDALAVVTVMTTAWVVRRRKQRITVRRRNEGAELQPRRRQQTADAA
ncbi:OpgC domain-containing protein [Burkholderia sp. Bp8963]|uniref:OpgC domain-containing protein n=1 Tax=Burkholderia sp. Bp8963 TaxID=2184547 RepID=UPI000F58FF96|nr:OpgC domain-containing protein [Burkholderia sp. Bp8963]RQS65788.1 OpgC domain-containing protein [Burkholderia sp. Bp8963]